MKVKQYHSSIFIALFLISTLFTNKIQGQNVQPLYSNLQIDLKNFMPIDDIISMNLKLYNAALNGSIKAYMSDTVASFYTKKEVLKLGTTEEYMLVPDESDPKKKNEIYKLIVNPFNPNSISSTNSISFKMVYDEKNDFSIEFLGLSLNYTYYFGANPIALQKLFVVSKADISKLLGEEQCSQLFANCYKAMIKTINTDSVIAESNTTTFQFKLDDFMGDGIRFDFNNSMWDAVNGLGLSGFTKPYPAYKTPDLKTRYNPDELWGSINHPAYYLAKPDSTEIIDTTISSAHEWTSRIADCKRYTLNYKWSYVPDKMIAHPTLSAIGLYFDYYLGGTSTFHQTIFWLDWNDAATIFPTVETTFFKYSIFKAFADFKEYNRLFY